MKVSSKGAKAAAVTRVRIERLRLRLPAGDARSAKTLAQAIASRLALRAGDLEGFAGEASLRARVKAPASSSTESVADAVVGKIAGTRGQKRGGR
ncbi:MAG TPA: hypothetical protein VF240_18600 [Pyrinomonadaceae bacterium]